MADEEVTPKAGADEEAVAEDTPATEDVKLEVKTEEDAADAGADATAAAAEPKKKKKRVAKPKKPIEAPKVTKSGYPKTADMIIYAIESHGGRKGSSVQAIKNFILKTYPTVKKEKLKKMLKSSLTTCVDAGALKRPDGKEDMPTLHGRYKVVKAGRSANPSYEEMVVAAVGALDERKGATVISIKAWIMDTYDHVRPELLRHTVRVGLTKALAKGAVAPHTPGKEGAKVSLASRWHIKGAAKKELVKKKAEERKAEAAKEAAKKKATAARESAKKKSVASKKAAPKKPTAKKPTAKKVTKKAAPKKKRR